VISGLSGVGGILDLINTVFPLIAWTVCLILFAIPALVGGVFLFSLLGHLTQFVFKKTSLSVDRN
jgi:hypothetical protein